MNIQVRGWFEGPYRVRVRALTAEVEDTPNAENMVRTILEERCWDEASAGPNFDTYTRRDLADDETVPVSERAYTYFEVTT